jgi:uncharacterized protein (TIGR02271 family)
MTRRKVASTDRKHLARVNATAEAVVPVVAEELKVGKRTVESGRVQITKHLLEREEVIDQPLTQEEVQVQRVPINRPIDRIARTRTEGDVTIIPIMEEVIVVQRQLMLKEELHVRRMRKEARQPQRIKLRSERAEIKRIPSAAQP